MEDEGKREEEGEGEEALGCRRERRARKEVKGRKKEGEGRERRKIEKMRSFFLKHVGAVSLQLLLKYMTGLKALGLCHLPALRGIF
jgi:hypothetical protein